MTTTPHPTRELLKTAMHRPDLRILLAGVEIRHDEALAQPFLAHDGAIVLGSAGDARHPAPLAHALRHGAEILCWRNPSPRTSAAERVAASLLAARTAACALALMSVRERRLCEPYVDADLPALLGPHADAPTLPNERLRALAQALLALAGDDRVRADLPLLAQALASPLFAEGWAVAVPTDHLLTTGGDSRLALDPESGLNRYGCSPRPRPHALTFASTTATSISEGAYEMVERLRRDLVASCVQGRFPLDYARAMAGIRTRLRRLCGADAVPGTEVVLTPSGTDAEFYALELALAGHGSTLTNLVLAPRESGSSVMPAAAGRHHHPVTALGVAVETDAPVDAESTARVRLEVVEVRDATGNLRASSEVDQDVRTVVERAANAGHRVLLHVLDTSKTGIVVPSPRCVRDLADRLGDSLDVVVDASQLRLCPEGVAGYLAANAMLIITGSKFFTGPPFAGALLIPPGIARRAVRPVGDHPAVLPAGYRDTTTRDCWPEAWNAYCRTLGTTPQIGLLFRWTAALWEMDAFHRCPPTRARALLDAFLCAVRTALEQHASLVLLAAPVPARTANVGERWDALPTVFTVGLRGRGGELHGVEALRRIYGWLNRDVSALLAEDASEADRALAATCCHVGQPVSLAAPGMPERCGLRMAAGARIVSGAADVHVVSDVNDVVKAAPRGIAAGIAPEMAVAHEIRDACTVLDKMDLLARTFDAMAASEDGDP